MSGTKTFYFRLVQPMSCHLPSKNYFDLSCLQAGWAKGAFWGSWKSPPNSVPIPRGREMAQMVLAWLRSDSARTRCLRLPHKLWVGVAG